MNDAESLCFTFILVIFIGVGIIITGLAAIIKALFPKTQPEERSRSGEKSFVLGKKEGKELQAVIKYIKQAKKDISTDGEIKSILREKGWTEGEIKEAFNSLN
jgi:hypothetical protein